MRPARLIIIIIALFVLIPQIVFASNFVKGELLIKFKPSVVSFPKGIAQISSAEAKKITPASINKLNKKFGLKKMKKVFKTAPAGRTVHVLKSGEKRLLPDLSSIYKLTFPREKDVLAMVAEYNRDTHVEFAEPNYRFTAFTPNDPYYADYPSSPNQWYLFKVKLHQTESATSGWNISTGETAVAIAVIDTGVDWNHPDLDQNVWTNSGDIWSNPASPETGDTTDNDSNGFVDDYKGWDFTDIDTDEYTIEGCTLDPNEDYTDRDNDPMDYHGHGTHCSGIASAATNNNTGVAGAGWNCQIICLRAGFKIYHPSVGWTGMLENDDCAAALQYAADMGAKIISMSWGGDHSSTIQSAIDYAHGKDCLLIAAAGNENSSTPSYPAAYPNVMAVAATGVSDNKASYSNYGSWIDISAPGGDGGGAGRILSTFFDDTYAWTNGTSMATPLVAGVAGLVRSNSPALTNEAVASRIRNTADDIDGLNPGYAGQLGAGRVNAARALDNQGPIITITSPSSAEQWPGGITKNLTWTATAEGFAVSSESISIYYSTDGGETFPNTIAGNISNSGSYPWDVPTIDSNSVRIKIAALDLIDNLSSETTANNLTIDSTGPDIIITSPIAGEQIKGGSAKTISWTASDEGTGISPESIAIYYSTDGGATFPNTIASGLSNSGSHIWNVPTIDASSVNIKIGAVDLLGHSSFEVSSSFAIDSSSPSVPTVDPFTSPTNITSLTITGGKSSDTAVILINGSSSGVSYPTSTSWSYTASLTSGTNQISIRAQDAVGNESSELTISIVVQELVFSDSSKGVSLTFPVGSTTDTPTVSFTVYDDPQALGPYPTARTLVGNALNITSNVSTFASPLTMTLNLPAGTLHPEPYYWDTATNTWSNSGLVVTSRTAASLTFTTSHLSVFAIFGVSGILSDILIYPNPFRLGSSAGIIFNGLTGDERIRIYTIAGELVNSYQMPGSESWTWDARNSTGKMVARGIYIYIITNNLGQQRAGKIAILE